jgi:hypothetical protein
MKFPINSGLFLIAVLVGAQPAMADPLSYDIDSNAELQMVSIYQKNVRKSSDEQLVVFDVTLKNADTVPQLFSVTVYIPGTGAGEGFAPAKGDAKVEPGEEATASVAILSQALPTQGYSITVRAVEDR